MKKCKRCDTLKEDTDFFIRKRDGLPYGRCKRCVSLDTAERLLKYKREAVDYLGGKCSICGYNKTLSALEFHHKDRDTKDVNYEKMKNWSFESKKKELDKCVLLCANCHREME